MGGVIITRNTPLGGFALLLHPKGQQLEAQGVRREQGVEGLIYI